MDKPGRNKLKIYKIDIKIKINIEDFPSRGHDGQTLKGIANIVSDSENNATKQCEKELKKKLSEEFSMIPVKKLKKEFKKEMMQKQGIYR